MSRFSRLISGVMKWGALGSFFKEKSPSQKRVERCLAPLIQKYEASKAAFLLIIFSEFFGMIPNSH